MRTKRVLPMLFVAALLVAAQTAGGLQWDVPAGWKTQPDRPMRAATYTAPAAAGDKEDAECIVSYFGPGQGGAVEANLKRWIGQFEQPDGAPRPAQQTVHGLPATTLEISGTYTGAGGPMAAAQVSKPGFRLLGAIVEGLQGAVFFKFTGPAKTVAAHRAAFQAMLASVRR